MTSKKDEIGGYQDKFWYPRFWDGMTRSAWLKACKSGDGKIAANKMPMAAIVSGLSFFNSTLAAFDSFLHGKKIAQTELAAPPIFIIGHWRSGTTLLHEYFVQDKQFTFADTYACYAPQHFLHSRYTLAPFVKFLMPSKRPIDNMAAGLDRPQEDEFAILSLGVPSPYRNILYPNNESLIDFDYLTLRNLTEEQQNEWLGALEFFLKSLSVQSPKQIVLKSPPHTGRIRTILKRFPDAKFVHIHRNPYKLFPSTKNLWLRLAQDEGLQNPTGEKLDEYVFKCFETMHEAFESDLPLLQKGQFIDISFKDLTSNPIPTMKRIYTELNLCGFSDAEPIFSEFAASQKDFKKNKFNIDPEIAAKIQLRWRGYIEKYGYSPPD